MPFLSISRLPGSCLRVSPIRIVHITLCVFCTPQAAEPEAVYILDADTGHPVSVEAISSLLCCTTNRPGFAESFGKTQWAVQTFQAAIQTATRFRAYKACSCLKSPLRGERVASLLHWAQSGAAKRDLPRFILVRSGTDRSLMWNTITPRGCGDPLHRVLLIGFMLHG